MKSVLHLLHSSADEQTRKIHQMLCQGMGPGYDCATIWMGPGEQLRNLPTAVLRLRRRRPEITFAWGIFALAAAVIARHPRILFSPDRFAGPRSLRWIRSLMGRGSHITMICPTFTQQRLAIQQGIDPDRCQVIPPGVDFGLVRQRRNAVLRQELGFTETDFVLIAPGESSVATGHDQAVWTCGILQVLDPGCKLLLWGRGKRAASMAELGLRLHQPDLVTLAEAKLGRRVEFEELLAVADTCLVTPAGAAPTLPIATVMAAGIPIVSTVTYMLAELLEDRHTALMVPKRSPRALTQRVMDLRADSAMVVKMTDVARAEAYEHFSMTRMLDEYRKVFAGEEQMAPANPR